MPCGVNRWHTLNRSPGHQSRTCARPCGAAGRVRANTTTFALSRVDWRADFPAALKVGSFNFWVLFHFYVSSINHDMHCSIYFTFVEKNERISLSTSLRMKACPKPYDSCGEISCISLENIVCHKLVGVLKRFLIDN